MPSQLIKEIKEGKQEVEALSPEAIKEIDTILTTLTKIAKRDHLKTKPSTRDRRMKIKRALNIFVTELGQTTDET